MMRPLILLSNLSALLFVVTGLTIAGNDLFVGIKSSIPAASAVVSLIFVATGLFLLILGKSGANLVNSIKAGHERLYARHSTILSILFTITVFLGVMILYAVILRIGQGFSVFG